MPAANNLKCSLRFPCSLHLLCSRIASGCRGKNHTKQTNESPWDKIKCRKPQNTTKDTSFSSTGPSAADKKHLQCNHNQASSQKGGQQGKSCLLQSVARPPTNGSDFLLLLHASCCWCLATYHQKVGAWGSKGVRGGGAVEQMTPQAPSHEVVEVTCLWSERPERDISGCPSLTVRSCKGCNPTSRGDVPLPVNWLAAEALVIRAQEEGGRVSGWATQEAEG